MRIGVFDSGVGGFSILKSIQEELPNEEFFYLCDQKNFPYGTKDQGYLKEIVTDACVRFFAVAKFDILVIACNSATTVALSSVRDALTCPVVGVVPAVKPAAALSKAGHIGILSTKVTSGGPYLKNLVENFAVNCRITEIGSSALVEIAERKIREQSFDIEVIRSELSPFFSDRSHKVDTIVLGCTHFPLLMDELKLCAEWPVQWVDSGTAVAKRVRQISLEIGQMISENPLAGSSNQGFTTGNLNSLWLPKGIPYYVKETLKLESWSELR
jgi:glutamate racemase